MFDSKRWVRRTFWSRYRVSSCSPSWVNGLRVTFEDTMRIDFIPLSLDNVLLGSTHCLHKPTYLHPPFPGPTHAGYCPQTIPNIYALSCRINNCNQGGGHVMQKSPLFFHFNLMQCGNKAATKSTFLTAFPFQTVAVKMVTFPICGA